MGQRTGWVVAMGVAAVLGGCSCAGDAGRTFRLTAQVDSGGPGFANALYQTTGVPVLPGNRVELVHNGRVFDVLVEDIQRARKSVHIVLFIWRPGQPSERVVEALAARALAGVECRVLVDPVGSQGFAEEVQPRLEAAGCQTYFFRPLPADENLARNHRKLILVDGRVGITGGLAIQRPWLGDARNEDEWRDTNVRVEGPAVLQMQQAFAENWQEVTGELLPQHAFPQPTPVVPAGPVAQEDARAAFVSSTAHPEVTRAERLTQLLVRAAKRRLWIAQAYFTPNEALTRLLVEKAQEGVDVRVLAPGDKNDQPAITLLQRASYDTLLPAGVRIWEFQPSMMHAKTMLVDDSLVLVGSINYDVLSFKFLEEGSLVVEDAQVARALADSFLADLERSREVGATRAE